MEYMKSEIIKKVNNYYGYRAINRVRFKNTIINENTNDKMFTKMSNKETKKEPQSKNQEKKFFFDEIEEGELKKAINSLGESMLNKIIK
tara:strand:+ start:428 stop:694 length:267 start_codon:yes stop_codon:yes gene_type:complete